MALLVLDVGVSDLHVRGGEVVSLFFVGAGGLEAAQRAGDDEDGAVFLHGYRAWHVAPRFV